MTCGWAHNRRQGPTKRDYFRHIAANNPARRIGTPADIAGAVLFAMTNTFMTGMTLKIDGGEPLV
jgi:NAD(P)-dependent dehydrogenase (short-subunit alcohol dehydrogenase family)